MLKNSSINFLDSLLVQSSNKNQSYNVKTSYNDVLQSIKNQLEKKSAQKNSISELEEKYQSELQKFNNEMMIYDMYHSAYIDNGFFGSQTKSKLRQQKYSAWSNIFNLQAERFRNQTQIAIQTALNKLT